MKQLYLKSIILAIFSIISIKASAYDCEVDGIYYNLDATAKTASVTSGSSQYSGAVTIPSSITYCGTIYSVSNIGQWAFSYCDDLTSIEIPNSLTNIGDLAFYSCSGLTSVTIGNSVTSIGRSAFSYCYGLTSIEIPNSVTSIGEGVFSDCWSLSSIVVKLGNSVYDSRNNCNAIIETASNTLVAGCKNTSIPSSVTCIGVSAFSGCESLTSIEIPSSVTCIGDNAFSFCKGLTYVEIPSSVTSIGGGLSVGVQA